MHSISFQEICPYYINSFSFLFFFFNSDNIWYQSCNLLWENTIVIEQKKRTEQIQGTQCI